MKYKYKDKSIDQVIFEAYQNEDLTWTVKLPKQSNELIYANEDFDLNFELSNDTPIIEEVKNES